MSGITITRRNDQLVAVKRATLEGRERRLREARLLARLDHPGVVQFIEVVEGDSTELHMGFASSDSWLRVPPTTRAGIVEGLATVAATVADLHDLGTTHGSLLPEHVVTADHRPVLCGLADADTANPLGCAADLAALGGLITFIGRKAPPDLRIELEMLAARATAGDLSVRELTAELNRLRTLDRRSRRRREWPRIRVGRTFAGATGCLLVCVLVAALLLRGPDDGDRVGSPPPDTVPATAPASRSRPPDLSGSEAPAPRSSNRPAPPDPESVGTEPVESTALVMVHEDRRYGLGRTGDIAVVGDWDCDKKVTPALLQPANGMVAIFTAWPEAGARLEPAATQIVADATDLEVETSGGCDRLRVIHRSGSSLFSAELP